MIDAKRRLLLKGSLGAGAVGVAVSAGLLTPQAVLAAWPEAAFQAKDQAAALTGLLESDATNATEATKAVEAMEASDAISVKAPDIAENGAVVPVTVETDLEGVQSISIISSRNQTPLIASFDLGAGAMPFVSTRIKMAESGDVIAVVKTANGLLSAAKPVKVTIGGCGG